MKIKKDGKLFGVDLYVRYMITQQVLLWEVGIAHVSLSYKVVHD